MGYVWYSRTARILIFILLLTKLTRGETEVDDLSFYTANNNCNQPRFTISEVAVDWQEPMTLQR